MTTHPAAVTAATPETRSRSARLLRLALRVDGLVTALNGAAYLSAAALLDDVLGLSPGPLRGVGGFLLVFSGAVWVTATRATLRTGAVRAVVAVNALWAIGSIAVALTGWGSRTTVGSVWILLQAAVVGGFAAWQLTWLRRHRQA